jgi:hypothetical protein
MSSVSLLENLSTHQFWADELISATCDWRFPALRHTSDAKIATIPALEGELWLQPARVSPIEA